MIWICTNFITVTCDNLFNKTNTASSDFTITMDYIATEGTTVTFGCPAYYVLVGPNTTTCMGNGKWEPDPREVECKGILLLYRTVTIIMLFVG